jgi:acyl carrier protein
MFLGSKNRNNNYKRTLRNFVKKNYFIKDSFTDSDSFFENGIIDSTGVLELVSFIEEEYDIEVEDEELVPENLDSINNLSNYLQKKLGDAD